MPLRLPSLSIALLGLFLAACASTPPATGTATAGATAAADAEKVHCTREIPVGSQMPVTRCRTLAQIDRERAEAANQMNQARQTGAATPDRVGR